jgi:hypothetical protein
MIFIEGHLIPGGDSEDRMRPLTLDDCRNYHNGILSSLMDAEELLDILIAEIQRLHTQAEHREQSLRDLGLAEAEALLCALAMTS